MNNKLPVILIISDRLYIQHSLNTSLENIYYLIEKESIEESLRVIQSSKIDFIIIDSKIKDSDPIEFISSLRKKEKLLLTPIFFISNSLKKNYREEAYKAGVNVFLNDPIDSEELFSALTKYEKEITRTKKISDLSQRLKSSKQKESKKLSNRIKKGKVK